MGYWRLDMGYRLLVIGYWIWAAKPHIRAFTLYTDSPCLYTRHSTLYTISASAPASNLSPYSLIPCQRQCFDADAIGRCSERYEVARVKTDGQFGRTS